MPTKVYAYSCKPPKSNVELIDSQFSLAHKFYNKLVELHREQHDRSEAARRELFPDLEAAEQAVTDAVVSVEAIVVEIRKANAKARAKRATPADAARLKAAKDVRKAAWDRRKEIRASIAGHPALQAKLAEIYAEYQGVIPPGKTNRQGGKQKEAARMSGVYWGTKAKVYQAIDDAQKKTIGPIRFKAWDGNGQLAMQIVGGCSWAELLQGIGAANNKARATPVQRASEKKCPIYRFRLRIQSDGDAPDCFVEVDAFLHRPLPDDAKVTWISLVRRRVAPRRGSDGQWRDYYDWSVQLTCEYADIPTGAPRGTCGVDVGWRVMEDDSLRIAYVIGDDGYNLDFRLPNEVRQIWHKAQSLQSIRDINFNTVMMQVVAWKQSIGECPDWLADATVAMHAWRAKGKLIRLMRIISEHMPNADILPVLDAWRAQDSHLYQWQAECVNKAERIRKDMYRKFAHRLHMRFANIAVEDCDWHKMRQHKPADDNTDDSIMRINMNAGSVGMLRAILKQKGAKVVSGVDTTQTCHACGQVNDWHEADLWHTCSACGGAWDRDFNAATNIYARGRVSTEDADTLTATTTVADGSPTKVGKWQRRKDERSKKQSRVP